MPGRRHSDEPLTLYLTEVRRHPALSAEEERALARRWREDGDGAALERLVTCHLPLSITIAKRFRRYGLPLADLIAEGNIGLMIAARRFEPERGFRFNTYARWWVRATIQEYVLNNWSLVKLATTDSQRKLFFNLRRLKARMAELDAGDLPPEAVAAIAAELEVPEADVVTMNRRLVSDSSLNAPVGEDGAAEWLDLLADDRQDQEHQLAEAEERAERRRLLKLGLDKLNDRDRRILVARRLLDDPMTTEELGRRFDLTRQRIGQIETQAVNALRKAITAHRRKAAN